MPQTAQTGELVGGKHLPDRGATTHFVQITAQNYFIKTRPRECFFSFPPGLVCQLSRCLFDPFPFEFIPRIVSNEFYGKSDEG